MAKREIKAFGDKLCCSICLDLLKDPVTIPCGHNYCMNCIKGCWDGEDQKHTHSCPQCRRTFIPRPALAKNTMLAELVEEMKKTGLQAAPADHCYAGPGDVSCDFCTGRKLKAIKSCLQCVVSYCEQHLQPHYNVAALKKHILVSPSENLQENICTNHNEVMKIFCRTDQQCICYLCSIDEHRDHCIVSAATEKNERQKELKLCHEKIHQKIKDREADVMVFQQRMEAINYSADEAVRDSEKIFNELMLLIEKRSSDIKQQIRSQQETELNRTRELLQQVQQELSELKRKDVQLEELSHTEDLIRFLHTFPSLSYICESTLYKAPRITLPPMAYFKDVVGAVSEMKDELQRMLSDRWQKRSQTEHSLTLCLREEMAKREIKVVGDKLCCAICLDLLKEPVTIPCGHTYCMKCIKRHFDEEDQKQIYRCPQCRQTFVPRPALVKNTTLAGLVEEMKKTGLQAALSDHCYSGPEYVACDFCIGRKLKAIKSCLQCVVSYCEQHLQLHHNATALKKHKLVDPLKKLQKNICPHHNEVMKIFCRTDQQCICYLCSLDGHKGHGTIPASVERTERQKELKSRREKIQQRIKDREEAVMVFLQEVDAINHSADKAVSDSEKILKQLFFLIKKKTCDIQQQIRSQQETEVNRAKEVLEKLQQELSELKRKDAELEQLSHTEDHTQFLHMFPLISNLRESAMVPSAKSSPLLDFEDVVAALSELKDKLQNVLQEGWQKGSQTVMGVDVLLPPPEPQTRAEFLQFSTQLTLDPNTVNTRLLLSERNRRVTFVSKKQVYPAHSERFMNRSQVLSRERLTGRHYWEVEWSGFGIYVAVAYKSISRAGGESEFGNNSKSWALACSYKYEFTHDKYYTSISGCPSSRIGVFLDHRAGILSFYSISETMTLLHREQTAFTQPLYAGLRAYHFLGSESSAVFCGVQQSETAPQ
ncbi:E3 ubiquitin/ISG15 ligase TRIM25-like [Archocentrus centrarchus]|uniref:E3 ubiquitin/ISG15 ligase TRIM25-like n=1 Tax=Archocentrus centrarchus TaxID=63155 RepID=UPI0011EA1992|nr:E3 ubiquitin/ISG15 ligase TRIM25-like [Archocentrus centrarchus]